MRDLPPQEQEQDVETDVMPVSRIVIWAVVGLTILAGVALYFRYERFMAPLL